MPAPATTGVLRENITDMKIGDYILWKYDTSNKYTFGGDITGYNEVPITGINWSTTPWSKEYFYGVKVDKGLIIADRVISNNVSWDTLNNLKRIQGLFMDSASIIPVMTSNTTPSGIASAISEYQGTSGAQSAARAFDSNTTTAENAWVTNGTPMGWLQYEFLEPRIVTSYELYPQVGYTARSPKDWEFEGWDGNQWIILDRRSGVINWVGNTPKRFIFSNKKPYLKYRINITANNGDSTYLAIQELRMFELTGIMRSLTGGSAYVDSIGNKSLTNQGLGAFPTNNEWDKYITNFPVGLIQSGKTLDDIFHWSVIQTTCQDTPMNGVKHPRSTATGATTLRTWRGSSSGFTEPVSQFGFDTSNSNQSGNGFRPVFEYKE
jgi:hypothetical protein